VLTARRLRSKRDTRRAPNAASGRRRSKRRSRPALLRVPALRSPTAPVLRSATEAARRFPRRRRSDRSRLRPREVYTTSGASFNSLVLDRSTPLSGCAVPTAGAPVPGVRPARGRRRAALRGRERTTGGRRGTGTPSRPAAAPGSEDSNAHFERTSHAGAIFVTPASDMSGVDGCSGAASHSPRGPMCY
jgi:hypothetical protein